jgi:streptogramin lyase
VTGVRGFAAGALAALLLACQSTPTTRVYRAEPANTGTEHYSAWFADTDGDVLYFGLSPFWELWWETGADALADLEELGDHLIGRFDLRGEHFLPPLRVRAAEDGARSSVWDVLAHSNGRIYYTTYFEGIGSVRSDGSDPVVYADLGTGFNELAEGPEGNVYVTRYSDAPEHPDRRSYGAVVVMSPTGELINEIRFPKQGDRFTAPKSISVDPRTGDIWINTDTFQGDRPIEHEAIHMNSAGYVLSRRSGPGELQFVRFDSAGRGWFAEKLGGELRIRIRVARRDLAIVSLGRSEGIDFVQDIWPTPEGGVVVARWSGRLHWIGPPGEAFRHEEIPLHLPPDCTPPDGRSLLYTGVVRGNFAYATLYCGPMVLRVPLDD